MSSVAVASSVIETTFSCGFVSRTMHQTGCSLDCKRGRNVGWGLVLAVDWVLVFPLWVALVQVMGIGMQ